MLKRSKLLLLTLSVAVIASLWTIQATVVAQAPTKTPIGEPPTKTPLPLEPSTKTPLPGDLPTQTAASTLTPTFTPQATATATPTPQPSATVSPTPVTRSPVPIVIIADTDSTLIDSLASPTPTITLNVSEAIVPATATSTVSTAAVSIGNNDPSASTTAATLPIITQAMVIGGFIFGVLILGLVIWLSLARLGRSITNEIHTVSLANLRLQHEAERLARRDKAVLRADSDVLSLLEQAILDASGESVHVRLLPNGWVSSPPMLAVVDAAQTRYIFSPTPPDQVQDFARRHGLTQLLLGHATDLTAYPIDALNSTPFIVDDLSSAFTYVLARHQAPRRPLPRTERWYLYIARPRPTHWSARFERRVRQTGMLRRFADRLPTKAQSDSARGNSTNTGD